MKIQYNPWSYSVSIDFNWWNIIYYLPSYVDRGISSHNSKILSRFWRDLILFSNYQKRSTNHCFSDYVNTISDRVVFCSVLIFKCNNLWVCAITNVPLNWYGMDILKMRSCNRCTSAAGWLKSSFIDWFTFGDIELHYLLRAHLNSAITLILEMSWKNMFRWSIIYTNDYFLLSLIVLHTLFVSIRNFAQHSALLRKLKIWVVKANIR